MFYRFIALLLHHSRFQSFCCFSHPFRKFCCFSAMLQILKICLKISVMNFFEFQIILIPFSSKVKPNLKLQLNFNMCGSSESRIRTIHSSEWSCLVSLNFLLSWLNHFLSKPHKWSVFLLSVYANNVFIIWPQQKTLLTVNQHSNYLFICWHYSLLPRSPAYSSVTFSSDY